MHILLIHQAYAGAREPGGTRHHEIATRLVAMGHEVTVVRGRRNYLTGEATGPPLDADAERVRVISAATPFSIHRSFVWRVAAFVAFMCTSTLAALRVRRVDLVIGTSPPIFQALSAAIVAALKQRPFLLEVRDLWPDFAIDMGVLRSRVLIAVARTVERFIYRRAAHIVVNSPAYREHLVDFGLAPEQITLIPNGVDPASFRPDSRGAETRRELGLEPDSVAVLYAGALGMANDIPTILAAARAVEDPSIQFLLVGDGKEASALRNLADEWQLSNVQFLGPVPKAEIPELMAASDICTATLMNIPMFKTTYPNKVFDYMAAGRPTVLGIDGVIRDVVEAAGAGIFVPPGDAEALARAVESLASDEEARLRMGSSGRSHVETYFHRDEQAKLFAATAVGLIKR